MYAAETRAAGVEVSAPAKEDTLLWRRIVEPIEPFLDAVAQVLAEQVETFEPEIIPYARYALTNQGKQLRPALVALSTAAVDPLSDPKRRDVVKAATVIEMVHLATLVHDDVMDEASVRRRRPTLAVNWGNQISVLLGDCLFAHALKLAASFPSTEVCRAVSEATKTVCSGEILQNHRQGQYDLDREEYFRILRMKTAELFALSCDLGAWLGRATPAGRAALRHFGLEFGMAYQIYDDCMDIFGSEARAGKSLGTDLASGKMTLPLLVAWERATPRVAAQLRERLDHWDAEQAAGLLEMLYQLDALEASRRIIHQYLESAQQALRQLPESRSRRALVDLTSFLVCQTDALGTGQPS